MIGAGELGARVARARAQLEQERRRDVALETNVDEARERLGHPARYLDEARLEQLRNAPVGDHPSALERGGWEHRHACPDCFAFRAPGSGRCKRCGSLSPTIPAHERARASAGTRDRANRRRDEKRRRVKRGR